MVVFLECHQSFCLSFFLFDVQNPESINFYGRNLSFFLHGSIKLIVGFNHVQNLVGHLFS